MSAIFREAADLLTRGEPFALAMVVRTRGSTPQGVGARLLVRADGTILGTLGGGCVEGDVWDAATRALKEGRKPELKHYALNEPVSSPHGMVCGGSMDVLIEPIREAADLLPLVREILDGESAALVTVTEPAEAIGRKLLVRADGSRLGTLGDPELDSAAVRECAALPAEGGAAWTALPRGIGVVLERFAPAPALVSLGGGHIAKALETFAKPLGFRFFVVDDRPMFANRDRFVEADQVLVADFAKGLGKLPNGPDASIVVATRGHRYDDVALEAAVLSGAGYVGLVSSRRKWLLLRERLLARGVPVERVDAVRAPVGLDVGARTPEEIALSILAELLMMRRGRTGRPLALARPAGETTGPAASLRTT